ncbi:ATP-dependent DNA helicase [Marinimicrobium agarilyticum]|uniref:ATP-dependent DNA helicase n=1 Tax=Marinimicrobium agarilyticum TaxID=306546 RepID=UPI0004182DB8|nr:ATP-dependent DNA helicase [Marinimicrobium agarilyticum]
MPESYRVSVRALCEFTAKTGDLDLRFTPSPTAREGMEGHLAVARRRNEAYQSEIALSGEYDALTVRGRADGYAPDANRLEEVKTFRGDLDLMPANHRALHWAQVKVYGWLMCQRDELEAIELALVYFDIIKQQETLIKESFQASELEAFFKAQCDIFLAWARQEMAHRQARDRAAETLTFPHADFRFGQRPLAEAVYQGAATGRCLLAEAPTGIGKTLGTLFPLVKAMPTQQVDKILFLTAKTPGRRLALDALAQLDQPELRTLELVARDKSCEHPDKACHGDSCPLAQGFYDRLPAARAQAVTEPRLTQSRLRELALSHNICPYYLSQEMTRWSDVIIGDYNYYYDQSAMLYALTTQQQWRTAVLVDEAHNLVERARSMYSARLDQIHFRTTKKQAPKALKKPLEKVHRAWNALNRAQPEDETFIIQSELPDEFGQSLQLATAAITDYLTEHPFALDSDLTQFYFDALQFLRIAELFDEQRFLCDVEWRSPSRGRKGTVVSLRNLIPAEQLKPRFEAALSTTLFSATLKPARYYRDLLGLPTDTVALEMASPFTSDQLAIHIAGDISTRYRDRAASIEPIARLIQEQYQGMPGNYLAFFSSYQYLQQVLEQVQTTYPELPLWVQDRRMSESARQAFLDKFVEGGQGVGFAVLGGVFGEGVDLPGNRLIGAFIATLGLPQVNPVNEALKQRLDEQFGHGYNDTYLYPGLRKVVQAAGRVIRSEQDRGVIHLIDDRFRWKQVKDLLPTWWPTSGD